MINDVYLLGRDGCQSVQVSDINPTSTLDGEELEETVPEMG